MIPACTSVDVARAGWANTGSQSERHATSSLAPRCLTGLHIQIAASTQPSTMAGRHRLSNPLVECLASTRCTCINNQYWCVCVQAQSCHVPRGRQVLEGTTKVGLQRRARALKASVRLLRGVPLTRLLHVHVPPRPFHAVRLLVTYRSQPAAEARQPILQHLLRMRFRERRGT
jgi:hypothetical protein